MIKGTHHGKWNTALKENAEDCTQTNTTVILFCDMMRNKHYEFWNFVMIYFKLQIQFTKWSPIFEQVLYLDIRIIDIVFQFCGKIEILFLSLLTSWYGNIFSITGPVSRRSIGGFPNKLPEVRSFHVFFFCWLTEQTVKQTIEVLVIGDAMTLMQRHCDFNLELSTKIKNALEEKTTYLSSWK